MAISHTLNGSADLTDAGWAEWAAVCVLNLRDVTCILGG